MVDQAVEVDMSDLSVPKTSPLRQMLRPSVIRRICQWPSGHSQDKITDIVYTNENFTFVECKRSKCTTCPGHRSKRKTSPFAIGADAALAKRNESLKNKKQYRGFQKPKMDKMVRVVRKRASTNPLPSQCLCTEFNGKVYKLMNHASYIKRKGYLPTMPFKKHPTNK